MVCGSRDLSGVKRVVKANRRYMRDNAPVLTLTRADSHPSLRSAPVQRWSDCHCQRRENDEIITLPEPRKSAPLGGSIRGARECAENRFSVSQAVAQAPALRGSVQAAVCVS